MTLILLTDYVHGVVFQLNVRICTVDSGERVFGPLTVAFGDETYKDGPSVRRS